MRLPERTIRLVAQLCAVVAVLVLASCASAPQRSPSEWMGVLPGDATMYVSVSVPRSADLIRRTLKQGGPAYNDVVQLADRTSRAVFSVTMAKGAPTRFTAVALGNYPAVLIRMSLSGKKEWKQMSASAGGYYLWNKANLQLSVPGGGVLLATNQDMPALLAKYKDPIPLPIPPEVASDMTKTDLVLYIPQLPGRAFDLRVSPALAVPGYGGAFDLRVSPPLAVRGYGGAFVTA